METEFQVCKNGYVTFHLGKIVKTYKVLWSVVRQALERLARPGLLSDVLGSSSTPSSLLSATMVTRALLAPIMAVEGRVVTTVNKMLVTMETLFCSSRAGLQWFGFGHAASPQQRTCCCHFFSYHF